MLGNREQANGISRKTNSQTLLGSINSP